MARNLQAWHAGGAISALYKLKNPAPESHWNQSADPFKAIVPLLQSENENCPYPPACTGLSNWNWLFPAAIYANRPSWSNKEPFDRVNVRKPAVHAGRLLLLWDPPPLCWEGVAVPVSASPPIDSWKRPLYVGLHYRKYSGDKVNTAPPFDRACLRWNEGTAAEKGIATASNRPKRRMNSQLSVRSSVR